MQIGLANLALMPILLRLPLIQNWTFSSWICQSRLVCTPHMYHFKRSSSRMAAYICTTWIGHREMCEQQKKHVEILKSSKVTPFICKVLPSDRAELRHVWEAGSG